MLASSDGDWNRGGFIKLWSTETGQLVGRLQHTGEPLSVAFSPDGKRIAAGAGDNTVKVWNLTP
jgi:WD40 repeat protein